jgi:protein gp37
MNKTKIEWTDYTWNPVTGCLNGCEYCYAHKIGKRFKGTFKPTFHPKRLLQPYKLKKPSKIFVCSMADLFGDWVSDDWISRVISTANNNRQHIFQFLTKNPKRYKEFTFSDNCWLGQTVVEKDDYRFIDNNNIKFVSFEPLLNNEIGNYRFPADWYIIGGLTPKPKHTEMAVRLILSQAEYFGTPVFMKKNLKPIWKGKLRQEFPKKRGY